MWMPEDIPLPTEWTLSRHSEGSTLQRPSPPSTTFLRKSGGSIPQLNSAQNVLPPPRSLLRKSGGSIPQLNSAQNVLPPPRSLLRKSGPKTPQPNSTQNVTSPLPPPRRSLLQKLGGSTPQRNSSPSPPPRRTLLRKLGGKTPQRNSTQNVTSPLPSLRRAFSQWFGGNTPQRNSSPSPPLRRTLSRTLRDNIPPPNLGPSPPPRRSLLRKSGSNISQRDSSPFPPPRRTLSNLSEESGTRGIAARDSKKPHNPCVVCLVKSCSNSRVVTCGLQCMEKLCWEGPANANMCDYCHRRPKATGHDQCGDTCRVKATYACLLCKIRPKQESYHLCGDVCVQISERCTPLILEVPSYHTTYDMVENKFKDAWKFPNLTIPTIKRIYKIIENKSFLQPYDRYKKRVHNEAFRYHGTTRNCNLGSAGNTRICESSSCPLCSILKTSFKTSIASPTGAFGAGIYTSSASNKAYNYTSNGSGASGVLLLTKVVLGKIKYVTGFNEVMSCPSGYDSVVYDRQNGCLNETIIYSDDAIRPVFLIVF